MDIGARNAAAVKTGLARVGMTLRAAETGGNRGRTLRLTVGEFVVTVKEAGEEPVVLFDGTAPKRFARRTAEVAA
jgi:chemotaxis protein CheD